MRRLLFLLGLAGAFSPLALTVSWIATPIVASAQDAISSAKAAGTVGERPDGLLGLVDGSATADVKALVDRINAERTQRYREIAQSTGQPLATVQAVAGERLIQATPPGQFIMNAAGRWSRR